MKRLLKISFLLFALPFMMSGCSEAEKDAPWHKRDDISSITFTSGPNHTQYWNYNDSWDFNDTELTIVFDDGSNQITTLGSGFFYYDLNIPSPVDLPTSEEIGHKTHIILSNVYYTNYSGDTFDVANYSIDVTIVEYPYSKDLIFMPWYSWVVFGMVIAVFWGTCYWSLTKMEKKEKSHGNFEINI